VAIGVGKVVIRPRWYWSATFYNLVATVCTNAALRDLKGWAENAAGAADVPNLSVADGYDSEDNDGIDLDGAAMSGAGETEDEGAGGDDGDADEGGDISEGEASETDDGVNGHEGAVQA